MKIAGAEISIKYYFAGFRFVTKSTNFAAFVRLMCTLVAANLRNPDCGHRLVDCLYTSPRHATCEYSSHYQAFHRIKILSIVVAK
jgi:hypothetical protein